MEPVRWGILSTALIGTAKVIPGMLKSKQLTVAAHVYGTDFEDRIPPNRSGLAFAWVGGATQKSVLNFFQALFPSSGGAVQFRRDATGSETRRLMPWSAVKSAVLIYASKR